MAYVIKQFANAVLALYLWLGRPYHFLPTVHIESESRAPFYGEFFVRGSSMSYSCTHFITMVVALFETIFTTSILRPYNSTSPQS